MKSKSIFTKKDILVLLGCVLFLLANLGAVGGGGRRRAKEAVCVSNLKNWGVVLWTFAEDNSGYFMNRDDAWDWAEALRWYYENPRLLLCPEATKTFQEGGRNPFMAWWREGDSDYLYKGSYCINLWISNEQGSGKIGSGVTEFWRTPYAAGAAMVPVLADGQWSDADPLMTDRPPEFEDDIWTPNRDEMRRVCISRHNGAVNMLFLDRSVRKIGLKHLWRQPWHRTWDVTAPLPMWPAWMANFKDPQ